MGGPTRLLDLTWSPYRALYFSVADDFVPDVVWAIDTVWLEIQSLHALSSSPDDSDPAQLTRAVKDIGSPTRGLTLLQK